MLDVYLHIVPSRKEIFVDPRLLTHQIPKFFNGPLPSYESERNNFPSPAAFKESLSNPSEFKPQNARNSSKYTPHIAHNLELAPKHSLLQLSGKHISSKLRRKSS